MDQAQWVLGLVKNGQFEPLFPHPAGGGSVMLTAIGMQEAVPPETGELDLTEYEGKALMVRGHHGGDWIYSAEVIDEAGAIVTAVVQRVFGGADRSPDTG